MKTNDSFLLFVLKLMETYYFNTGRLGMKKNPYENYIKKFNVEFIS